MTHIRAHAVVVVVASLMASVAVAKVRPVTLELKLPKKPTIAAPALPAALRSGPVAVVVTDERNADDPAIVGGQRIKGEDVYFWKAAQPVAPAVQDQVVQVLRGWSVEVAPEAAMTLRLGLSRYFVNERSDTFGSTYIAEVKFQASVTDGAGSVLWTGEANGDAKRPGIDARASMCNEALSLALGRALAQGVASIRAGAEATAAPVAAAPPPAASAGVLPVTVVHVAAADASATAIEPAVLLADLKKLAAAGVAEDVLVGYIAQRKLTRPLTVDEILEWKNAGLPDAAIKAATRP